MGENFLQELSSASGVASTDILMVVRDPGGVPASYQVSGSTLFNSFSGSTATANLIVKSNSASKIDNGWLYSGSSATANTIVVSNSSSKIDSAWLPTFSSNDDGWVSSGCETWTYSTASKVLIPADATNKYQKGDKVKLDQTTTKYFYVSATPTYSGSNTTLTLFAGSDYTVANAAITNNYFSKVSNPQGFPSVFNFTVTYAGFSANPSGGTNTFWLNGKTCFVNYYASSFGTSNATNLTMSLPITSAGNVQGFARSWDNSVAITTPTLIDITTGATVVTVYKDMAGASWTSSGSKMARISTAYPI